MKIVSKIIVVVIGLGLIHNDMQAVSVGELVTREPRRLRVKRGWVPGVRVLDLSGLDITSLEGLEDILGIESVTRLYLDNNNIPTIEPGDLAAAVNLSALSISGNDLENIEPNAFAGLKKLKVLNLSNNRIDSIPQDGLNGMPNLRFLSMNNNPMPNPKGSLQVQVPRAFITTLPITKANIRKWSAIIGAGAVALVAAVAGITAVRKKQESERQRRSEEEVEKERRERERLRIEEEEERRGAQAREYNPEELEAMEQVNYFNALSPEERGRLSEKYIRNIPVKIIPHLLIQGLNAGQIKHLTDGQTAALTPFQVKELGHKKQEALELSNLSPEALKEIKAKTIKDLDDKRKQNLKSRDEELTDAQKIALHLEPYRPTGSLVVHRPSPTSEGEEAPYMKEEKKDFLGKLMVQSAEEWEAMGEDVAKDIPDEYISSLPLQNLSPAQIAHFSPEQTEKFTRLQIGFIRDFVDRLKQLKISHLSKDALQAIPSTQIPFLTPAQKQQLRAREKKLTDNQKAALGNNNSL